MSSLKDQLTQRLNDLKGQPGKHGPLIETQARLMLFEDLMFACDMAEEVVNNSGAEQSPTIEDVLAINSVYQNYIGPAYQTLVGRGDIPAPSAPTTPSSGKTKDELIS
jgi:hypothetical protein